MGTYGPAPDDLVLDAIRWLREEIYPGLLGEVFDDRAHAVWIAGSRGYLTLWQSTEPHDQPLVKHQRIKEELYRRIDAVAHPPTPGPHPDPLVGQLRVEGRAFRDDTGPRLPVLCHAGDLIGQAMRFGLAHVEPALDAIAAAGYHGLRSWINVEPHVWWANKPAPSWNLLDDRAAFRDALRAGAARGLRWHLASGGLANLGHARQREMFDGLADVIGEMGPEHVALVETCNEARDTTDDGDETPAHLASLVARVHTRFPSILTALTAYTGTEERDVMQRYTPDAQRFAYVHGYRGGRAHDKLRHIFSFVYEVLARQNGDAWSRELGWQGEPFGPGRLVSAMDAHHELDAGVMGLAACMAAMSRQVWTFMSGPGVILHDEPLEQMPGFALTPALVRQLPQDLMTWPILGHAGDSKRGLRIHAARGDVRADYAIARDGKFVEVTYGPPEQIDDGPLTQERATRDVQRIHSCAWGHVDVGHLA